MTLGHVQAAGRGDHDLGAILVRAAVVCLLAAVLTVFGAGLGH